MLPMGHPPPGWWQKRDSLATESSAARDSSSPTESTLLSQPLHVYGLSASCLWCGCVEAGHKYGCSLLASNMYGLTPSRKGIFARKKITHIIMICH